MTKKGKSTFYKMKKNDKKMTPRRKKLETTTDIMNYKVRGIHSMCTLHSVYTTQGVHYTMYTLHNVYTRQCVHYTMCTLHIRQV